MGQEIKDLQIQNLNLYPWLQRWGSFVGMPAQY